MRVLESFNSLPRIKRMSAHVWHHFGEHRLFDEAASLSYTSLLSMVPLLAVIFGIASAFPVFQQWSAQLQDFVFKNFVPASGEQVQEYLESFLASVGQLTLPSMFILIVTALLLMVRIERTFNLIWRVPTARSFRNRIVMYWAVLTLGPLALGAAAALSAQPHIEQLTREVSSSSAWRDFGVFSLSWIAFTLMFSLVPNRKVPLTHALVGAFLSAVLFAIAKKAFVTYVENASFNVIYGTLAAIPIFLFWLYIVWVVVLLGASLAASMTTFKDRKTDWSWPAKWRFLFVYRLIGYLWKAQTQGRTHSMESLLELLEGAEETELARELHQLYDAGIVTRDEYGDWLLSRDLDSVSLLDLYRAGQYYLPVNEKLEIPSDSEWDKAFFRSVVEGELDMERSLKDMYKSC